MPLIVTVNTIAECLRTDCNSLEDKVLGHSKISSFVSQLYKYYIDMGTYPVKQFIIRWVFHIEWLLASRPT